MSRARIFSQKLGRQMVEGLQHAGARHMVGEHFGRRSAGEVGGSIGLVLRGRLAVAGMDKVVFGSDYPYLRRDLAVACRHEVETSEAVNGDESSAVVAGNALNQTFRPVVVVEVAAPLRSRFHGCGETFQAPSSRLESMANARFVSKGCWIAWFRDCDLAKRQRFEGPSVLRGLIRDSVEWIV
jgi:hypothetical protein